MPGLTAIQIPEEINVLTKKLEKRQPRTLLEIGTYQGGTLFLFCMAAAPDATIISVDIPAGPEYIHGPSSDPELLANFARPGQKLHLVQGDSHKPETLLKVRELLNRQMLDFLFIDGDHTYEGVRKDFSDYAQLVRPKGLIALHDIVWNRDRKCRVNEFWDRIKKGYRHREIVKDRRQGWGGIGLIYQKNPAIRNQ